MNLCSEPSEPEARSTPPASERRAWRIDLVSGVLFAGTLALLEMGPALAKKAFGASDLEVAVLASGQSVGLLLSFWTAHRAASRRRVSMVSRSQLLASLFLVAVAWIDTTSALWFVALHVLARVAFSMTISTRVVVWNAVFPTARRGRLVARLRQVQLLVATMLALGLSAALDWASGTPGLTELLGRCPLPADTMARVGIPVVAALGIAGSLVYRRLDEPPRRLTAASSPRSTLRRFVRVWREDHAFRRYQQLFFLVGTANIMVTPLIPIYAVDRFQASYSDLAWICVAIVQGTMALTMVWWGRRLDGGTPSGLRGTLNLVLACEMVCLILATSVEWIYVGAVFRGAALGGGTLLWMLGPLWFARSGEDDAVYTGIHACLTGVRWAIAPFVGVAVKSLFESDARPVFALSFLLLVGTGVLLLRDGSRERAAASDARDGPASPPPPDVDPLPSATPAP